MSNPITGQVKPAALTWTTLYQALVPVVISTVRAASVGAADRIDVKVTRGAASSDAEYLAEYVTVPRGIPYSWTEGWVLRADDAISVRSYGGVTAFNLFGKELD